MIDNLSIDCGNMDIDNIHNTNPEYPEGLFGFDYKGLDTYVGPSWMSVVPKQQASADCSTTKKITKALKSLCDEFEYESAVYVLDCDSELSKNEFVEKASNALNCPREDIPSYYWAAFHDYNRLYVGKTKRLHERIDEHNGMKRLHDGANFTQIFPPIGLFEIVFILDQDTTENILDFMEWKVSKTHNDEGDSFVSSDALY